MALRRAKTEANARFTSNGEPNKNRKPVTLPTLKCLEKAEDAAKDIA